MMQAFDKIGGRFCLSDDSHGVEQIALNYDQCIPYLERNHIARVYFLQPLRQRLNKPLDSRFPNVGLQSLALHELRTLPFWQTPLECRLPQKEKVLCCPSQPILPEALDIEDKHEGSNS